MFLTTTDLGQVIYEYQINEITEGDTNIVLQALAAAEQEVRSYLEINVNRAASIDGRLLYDVPAIFAATGTERNPLILQHSITVAKYHVIQLCNMDVIYEQAEKRYDRAVSWLKMLAKGDITLTTLPVIALENNPVLQPFSMGTRPKFNHE